ncbi:hypothetical protein YASMINEVIRUS_223 [Yasminevirus sp. GU-2018]|uniref:Phytanoyl-CoA dioxygenase n=1 Tax=Yasminevirus sp. GU-2018 TaxID=2420051 RepID=A0A5K0U7G3_9VIRU|nr:hypothetical protein YASMINEVIRUS_223 [Yasminevirus sp. GU-2018]
MSSDDTNNCENNADYENNFGTVDFDDADFETKLIQLVKEYGVVVIKGVVPQSECDSYVDRLVTDLETVSDFDRTDLKTWTQSNLPLQVRPGMFHCVVCNTPTVNELRFNENIVKIFTTYYTHFKKREHNPYRPIDMIVSNDGLNIKPGSVGPFDTGADWAHLDQTTEPDNPFKCIQGQIVLSNTTACFRASPKSHLLFRKILRDNAGSTKGDGFLKFAPEQYFELKKMVDLKGGSWQIKIPAQKGDFIIWTSATIHSATLQSRPVRQIKQVKVTKGRANKEVDVWNGWRCVVFICYRPREEFTEEQLRVKYSSFEKNLVTNHWGTKIFPRGFNRQNPKDTFSEKTRSFIEDPSKVYGLKGYAPNLTPEQKIMMGDYAEIDLTDEE